MKRISTVWLAAAKNLWWKLLIILAAMSAAEIGLYRSAVIASQNQYEDFYMKSFPVLVEEAGLKLVFFAALMAVTACCCLQGSRFSGKNYTLQRLPMAEWKITALWAVTHLACFVILWAAQVVLISALWSMYAARFHPAAPGLDLLVSFYNNGFLHAMLPLADVTRWIYLVAYWLCMAFLTATFGFFQRRGRYRISLLIMLACYFTLIKEIGSFASNLIFTILCLIVAAVDAFAMWEVYHEAKPD